MYNFLHAHHFGVVYIINIATYNSYIATDLLKYSVRMTGSKMFFGLFCSLNLGILQRHFKTPDFNIKPVKDKNHN